MKRFKFIGIGTALAVGIAVASCDLKDALENALLDQKMMKVSAEVEFAESSDFNALVSVANEESFFSGRLMASCADITVDNTTPGAFPKTITINYGNGCTQNGITRSGIVTITVTGYIRENGSQATIVRSADYTVNGRKVEGTVVYLNETTNVNTPQWTRTVEDGKVTVNDNVYTHTGTRTVKQTAGVNTVALSDNVYEILDGTQTVTNEEGKSLSVTVITPLVKKQTCNYISKGSANLEGSFLNGVLDYGDGECDGKVTYTNNENGKVFEFEL